MGHVSHFRPRLHLFYCDVCGGVHHSDRKEEMWNGLIVDPRCYDIRHPQDFVRGRVDRQSVDKPRPEGGNQFLSVTDVTSTNFDVSITPDAIPEVVFLEPGDVTADDL